MSYILHMKSSYQKPKEFHLGELWIGLILMAVLALNGCATINQQGVAAGPDPDNQHMLILQARYAAQLEHYDDAIALLDQVLVIEPSMADVYIIKSRILEAQGKREESKQ